MESLVVASSDGHATAPMAGYRPYLDQRFREEFDAFLPLWQEHGSGPISPRAVVERSGTAIAAEWERKVLDPGRHEGIGDPDRRLKEMDAEGIAADVIFPDFGLPFELYTPSLASALGYPPRRIEVVNAANRAYNRWLVDFCSVAPERFAGMAIASWDDPEATVKELTWARDAGLRGVVPPKFDPKVPLYSPRFEPVWSAIEDLDLVVNTHTSISSVSNLPIYTPDVPHPGSGFRLFMSRLFFECREILAHLIWGGVLERHPRLTVVLTEQGSGWIIRFLEEHDYAYEKSLSRRDVRDCIRLKPSEYFARQCYLGSSIFSRAEVDARHEIGVGKMMIGMDYPHQEGTLLEGTRNYLQATFGAAAVPIDDARRMLATNAVAVFGFDLEVLADYAVDTTDILTAPATDLYPLGDVRKPLV